MTSALRVEFEYEPYAPDKCAPARRLDDLHPQQAFHEDRYHVRYRAALAGTGGGKTHAATFEDIMWAITDPGSVGLLCEPDIPMVKRTLIPALERHLGPLDSSPLVSFNKTELRLDYPNGSRQWLVGLAEAGKTEGMSVDYVHVDEARLVRDWAAKWRVLKRQLRGSRPNTDPRKVGAWITTHSPTKEQVDEFEGPTADPTLYRVYRWSTRDAPGLDKVYLNEILRSHTGAAAQAVIEGLHARPEGIVYDQFDPHRHIRSAPARTPRAYDYVSYGVDWGWTLPAAILAITWTGETAHVVEEVYGSHLRDDELVTHAKRLTTKWGRGTWWCGADKPEHINKFRAAGLDARAFIGKVEDGVDLVNNKYGANELYIAPECVHTIGELDLYERDPVTGAPRKGNDHALDAKRYGTLGGRVNRRARARN